MRSSGRFVLVNLDDGQGSGVGLVRHVLFLPGLGPPSGRTQAAGQEHGKNRRRQGEAREA
jgi:hypothetical protein